MGKLPCHSFFIIWGFKFTGCRLTPAIPPSGPSPSPSEETIMFQKSLLSLIPSLVLCILLASCSSDRMPAGEYIELPADGAVLVVGNPDRNVLDKLKSTITKESLTAPYRMLDEDSLFNYRNLILLRVESDSLTNHRRRAVERFASAGGRVLIVDNRETVPYEWAWYNNSRSGEGV